MSRRRPRLLATCSAIALVVSALSVPSAVGAAASRQDTLVTLAPVLQALAVQGAAPRTRALVAERAGVAPHGPGSLEFDADGAILVTVRLSSVAATVLATLRASGATIEQVDPTMRVVTLEVAPSELRSLGATKEVLFVEPVLTPMSYGVCPTGNYVSEGDTQLDVAAARARYHVTGKGVTVGVIGDSFNAMGGEVTDERDAELPGPDNPCGYTTPVRVLDDANVTDEGRAMAEIVHELAPGARIDFATGTGSEEQVAANILALAHAGAKVIVDDMGYYDEPLFQESVVSAAINKVTAEGVAYFSAAGDSNKLLGGRDVGSYDASHFDPVACPAPVTSAVPGARCHNFSTSGPADPGDTLTFSGPSTLQFILGYNEPQGGITSDLDLALVNDASGKLVDLADTNNLRSQQASQLLSASVPAGSYDLVVASPSGTAPRFKFILVEANNITGVQYDVSSPGVIVGPTMFGHNGALGMSSEAAVPYDSSSTVEAFSSRGPAYYCYGPVTGAAPAKPLKACVTKQVSVAATDGVISSWFGHGTPLRFWGTSASTPHAAAIAALQLQRRPCATPASIFAAQAASGRRVGAYGANAIGAGLVDAVTAVGDTKCGQRITFRSLPSRPLGTAPFSIAADATASSHLRVGFRSTDASVCTVKGTIVDLRGRGSCAIEASQPGDGTYLAAASVTRSFAVTRRSGGSGTSPRSE